MGLFENMKKETKSVENEAKASPVRFKVKSKQSFSTGLFYTEIAILVDVFTGVNYVLTCDGEASNMIVLIGADGKPVVDEITESLSE